MLATQRTPGTRLGRRLWVVGACALYLLLATYQLGLPGLHYDEAKEAGVNAAELLTGSPVTAFRGAAVHVAGRQFPLMVQDYIGALNVYLALPVLALTGIGVPNLRALGVLAGLAALLLMERAVSSWVYSARPTADSVPPTWAGVSAMWLLAASPSFVFWSRQGIFVTNLMQPLVWLAIWQGVRWLQTGSRRNLLLGALACGLALYAKLLAVWVIGPLILLLALGWWQQWRQGRAPGLDLGTVAGAVAALAIPLLPLALFNWQTGGTWSALTGNALQSYYGVDNRAIWDNAWVRWAQLGQSLRGDQFWYLGGLYGNPLAPWLAAGAIAVGLLSRPRRMAPVLLLVGAAVVASIFTISALFITHYALVQPLVVAAAALGLACWLDQANAGRMALRRAAVGAVLLLWVALDLRAVVLYHQALARSGGLADHSDATYHLAYHLRYSGLGAPLALDWGMDAPVRFLSENTVRPIELFGYESPNAPDPGYGGQLAPFLANPDNVYLVHTPDHTVFHGRREAFLAEVANLGLEATRVETFGQRDGTLLFEVWRVGPLDPENATTLH